MFVKHFVSAVNQTLNAIIMAPIIFAVEDDSLSKSNDQLTNIVKISNHKNTLIKFLPKKLIFFLILISSCMSKTTLSSFGTF